MKSRAPNTSTPLREAFNERSRIFASWFRFYTILATCYITFSVMDFYLDGLMMLNGSSSFIRIFFYSFADRQKIL